MRVLAIGAHPDDVEGLCAGTLIKCAARGDHVTIMVATNGNVGSPTLSREEIAAIRKREAEASASLIGADLIWMDYDDEFLFHDRATRLAFIDAIRKANPDFMIVHGAGDYHPDHRISGEIAVDCRIPVTVPLIETAHPPMTKIPHVFFMDHIGGIGFEPEVYVDVSDVMELKSKMIRCHRSQDEWLRHMYDSDYAEMLTAPSGIRGKAIGVPYAEAFRSLPLYPVMGGAHLLPK